MRRPRSVRGCSAVFIGRELVTFWKTLLLPVRRVVRDLNDPEDGSNYLPINVTSNPEASNLQDKCS
jgi:hypothetical protein